MPRYKVVVDDNFHYQDPDERREQGVESLYDRFTSFGDDPSIVVIDGTDDRATFSAWSYAKERCAVICGEEQCGTRRRP
jgi:hypothetical protein